MIHTNLIRSHSKTCLYNIRVKQWDCIAMPQIYVTSGQGISLKGPSGLLPPYAACSIVQFQIQVQNVIIRCMQDTS